MAIEGQIGQIAQSAVSSGYYAVIIVLWLAILGGVGVLAWYIAQYKHHVTIREIVHGRKIIKKTKAREIKENGITYWKLLGTGQLLPLPPPQAIELNSKGKKWVDVYKTENGEWKYIVDHASPDENTTFEALDTNQRIMLIDQIEQANTRKKVSFTEILPAVTSALSLVIIIIILFAFWNNITQPMVTVSNANADTAQKMQLAVEKFVEFCGNAEFVRADPTAPIRAAPN